MQEIKGYRELSADEVRIINAIKELEQVVLSRLNEVRDEPSFDQRAVALARTNLEQGFMWMTRAIARPN